MKIYEVEFEGMYPVPNGLIICAEDWEEAHIIAEDTVKHTSVSGITEKDISKSGVLFYESGDY